MYKKEAEFRNAGFIIYDYAKADIICRYAVRLRPKQFDIPALTKKLDNCQFLVCFNI